MNATKNRIAIQEYKHNGQFVAGTNTDEHLYAFDRQALEQAVRAVNSYDAMLDALEAVAEEWERLECPLDHLGPQAPDWIRRVKTALALANGSRD